MAADSSTIRVISDGITMRLPWKHPAARSEKVLPGTLRIKPSPDNSVTFTDWLATASLKRLSEREEPEQEPRKKE